MTAKTVLRGITWNHSRGFVSVVATAQRYCELHPDVEITWEKRSLQEFANAPIQGLAEAYDLLVIDHPWAGYAAYSQVLVALQDQIPADYLADQAANSVGHSHASYVFGDNQCALAIDAATPVASYRPDLLGRYGLEQPQTWQDLLALARQGRVIMPGIEIDTLMNFYMLCATQGQPPFVEDEWAVSDEMSLQALEQLRELAGLCPRDIFGWNPIAVYEALSRRDEFVYCPFAYGYSNYSRQGYSDNILVFDDMVDIDGQGRCQTTLGGTVFRYRISARLSKSLATMRCFPPARSFSVRYSSKMADNPGIAAPGQTTRSIVAAAITSAIPYRHWIALIYDRASPVICIFKIMLARRSASI